MTIKETCRVCTMPIKISSHKTCIRKDIAAKTTAERYFVANKLRDAIGKDALSGFSYAANTISIRPICSSVQCAEKAEQLLNNLSAQYSCLQNANTNTNTSNSKNQTQKILFTFLDNANIDDMIKNGVLTAKKARKTALIQARNLSATDAQEIIDQGGFKTIAWSDNGDALVETVNKKIHANDWLVTQIIQGHENCYVSSSSDFARLYSLVNTPVEVDESTFDESRGAWYKPLGEERTIYEIPEDMNIELGVSWGTMKIRGGGVILPTRKGNTYYGIGPEEFKATHSIIS